MTPRSMRHRHTDAWETSGGPTALWAGGRVSDEHGKVVAHFAVHSDAVRAVACSNPMAGIDDPQAFLDSMATDIAALVQAATKMLSYYHEESFTNLRAALEPFTDEPPEATT